MQNYDKFLLQRLSYWELHFKTLIAITREFRSSRLI